MPARKYEPGQYLNGILLLAEAPKTHGNPHRKGVFQCPYCSNTFTIWFNNVVTGNTKSCGCQQYKEPTFFKHGHNRRADLRSRTYNSWAKMVQRCTNPNYDCYHNYGGRGIKVCESWLKFENFLEDMGERPINTSLDRFPNMNGNYEKSNCRWATPKEQGRNTRKVIMVEYNGKMVPLKGLSEKFKVDHKRALEKHKKGIPLFEILRGESTLIPHSFGVIAA